MKMSKHRIRSFLVILMLAVITICMLLSAGCQDPENDRDHSELTKLEEIQERGVLKVGTTGDYMPMSYLDPGTGGYVGFDNDGVARYACYRSTNGQKIVGDAAGSDKRFSFRTNAKGRKLHVFECPIDMLSYLTLIKMQTGKWLSEPMLSLGGVYEPNRDPSKWKLPVALQNMLQDHSEVTSIALHLDNDTAGKSAAWAIEGILRDKYNVSYEPPPRGKDYNEYLMYLTLGYKR